MAELTEWLNIMLGEISRKQDDAVRAEHEQQLRERSPPAPTAATAPREAG